MPETTKLSIVWNKFTGVQGSLVMSPSEFKRKFLFGIPLCNAVTGQTIDDSVIANTIKAEQEKLENEFGIKLFKQFIQETKDFVREELMSWGFIKTSWPINRPCLLEGRLNEREIIAYPKEWLTIRRSNPNDNIANKALYIVPNGDATVTFNYIITTYPHYFNFYGSRIIPNYWNIQYITGFDRVPTDLMDLIGHLVAIKVLPLIELTVGRVDASTFGQASGSLSFDGLSQSSSKMNGGNIFQQRIKLYQDIVKTQYEAAKGVYGGIKFDVC